MTDEEMKELKIIADHILEQVDRLNEDIQDATIKGLVVNIEARKVLDGKTADELNQVAIGINVNLGSRYIT